MKNFIIGLLLIVIVGLLLYFEPRPIQAPTNDNTKAAIVDFETCAEAGNPITQADPPVCTTSNGKIFVGAQTTNPDVVIATPVFGDLVSSPMIVKGKARGTWFFEANLPIVLKDQNGTVLIQQGYHTNDNWMTTDYVNIDTALTFPTPSTDYGVLEIHNDNPSGLPENDKSFAVPVRFK